MTQTPIDRAFRWIQETALDGADILEMGSNRWWIRWLVRYPLLPIYATLCVNLWIACLFAGVLSNLPNKD